MSLFNPVTWRNTNMLGDGRTGPSLSYKSLDKCCGSLHRGMQNISWECVLLWVWLRTSYVRGAHLGVFGNHELFWWDLLSLDDEYLWYCVYQKYIFYIKRLILFSILYVFSFICIPRDYLTFFQLHLW